MSNQPGILSRFVRVRFGLKTLFVLLTILCAWLGYQSIRRHRAMEMLARHDQVVETIVQNFVNLPPGTDTQGLVGNADFVRGELQWGGHLQPIGVVMARGAIDSIVSKGVSIDVSKSKFLAKRPALGRQWIDHFGQGLDKAGLSHCYEIGSSTTVGYVATNVWASPRKDRTVVVEAVVSSQDPQVDVRVIFIDSQQLIMW